MVVLVLLRVDQKLLVVVTIDVPVVGVSEV